jgi:hypothetical protein
VGVFTTKTAKKDGAEVLLPPNREKRRGRLLVTTIFVVLPNVGLLCRHQKREFLSPPKLRENLKSPPNPGVTPKASDFERVSTKTERTP